MLVVPLVRDVVRDRAAVGTRGVRSYLVRYGTGVHKLRRESVALQSCICIRDVTRDTCLVIQYIQIYTRVFDKWVIFFYEHLSV